MLIDWFTVGAQALNFLILVWLMKRFLYKPILNAIDAREKRIAKGTRGRRREKGRSPKGARRVPAQERGVRPAARRALEQSDGRGEGRTPAAPRRSAEGADALSSKRQEALEKRRAEPESSHQPRTQQEVFAIARKALTDLATTSLEERLGEVFTAACERWTARRKKCSASPQDSLRTRGGAQHV
jgi:F-type H+-transporting ATPase subunit b